jgi:hypothetical protein
VYKVEPTELPADDVDQAGEPATTERTCPVDPIDKRPALFTPVPIIKSPVEVIGESALNAAEAVVCPVPPFAIATVPVTFPAVPAVAAFKFATWVVLATVNGAVPVATVDVITPDAETVEKEPAPLNIEATSVPVEGVYL